MQRCRLVIFVSPGETYIDFTEAPGYTILVLHDDVKHGLILRDCRNEVMLKFPSPKNSNVAMKNYKVYAGTGICPK